MIDRTGQAAIVHSTGFWPWMISLITSLIAEPGDSYWNHMVFGISPTECVSAEGKGVTRRLISDFPNAVWSEFEETPAQRENAASFAEKQIGKPYAFLDDFLIGVGILLRRHSPKWLKKRLRSGKRWECAELAGVSLEHGGVHNIINDDRPYAATYPASYAPVWRDFGWLPVKPVTDLTAARYWTGLSTRGPWGR